MIRQSGENTRTRRGGMRFKLAGVICFFVALVSSVNICICQGSEQCSFASTATNPEHCFVIADTVYAKVGVDLIFPVHFKVILEDGVGVVQFKKGTTNVLEVKEEGKAEIRLTTEDDKVGVLFKIKAFP
jgi:hypothetical protein